MFFMGFSKTLKKMGGMRVGIGFRVDKRKKNAKWLLPLVMIVGGMVYLLWYLFLLILWGFYWTLKIFYLAFKGIYSLIKGKKHETLEEQSEQERSKEVC
ncbi:MAG: hypothetical protein FWD39_00260 [Clostridiales bacterium]|nr:hypothetical protein [Clostridiales bacterium]